MPDPIPPSPASPPPALDRDLYCLTCGYNLRGLSGDPVRCPECGNLNPIGDIELPAEIISRQLHLMERAPFWCTVAMLFGLPAHMLFWAVVCSMPRPARGDTGVLVCVSVPTLVSLIVWSVGCIRFRYYCQASPGWVAALLKYHLWSLGQLVGVWFPGGVLLWVLSGPWNVSRGPLGRAPQVLVVVVCAAAICAAFASAGWVHRRATARFATLQRAVAVRIARDVSRRRMAHQGRGWLP